MVRVRRSIVASPLKWLALLFCLIPAFGLWYDSMPNKSLHDSNLELESAWEHDAYKLLPAITTMVRLRVTNNTWAVAGTKLQLVAGSVRATGVARTDEGRPLVKLEGYYRATAPRTTTWEGKFWQWIEISTDAQLVRRAGSNLEYLGYEVVQAANNGVKFASALFSPPVRVVFPLAIEPHPAQRADVGLFVVEPEVSTQLDRVFNAAEGNPYESSGLWLRSLYLSATTVTTLGLGDITPVSSEARAAVVVEALAGLLIIGLFLNALARQIRQPT